MKIRLLVEKQLNEAQQNKEALRNSLYVSMPNGAFVDFVFLEPLELCYKFPYVGDTICREITKLPVHKAKVVQQGRQLSFADGHELAQGFALMQGKYVSKKWFLDSIAERQEAVDFKKSTVSFEGVTFSFESLRYKHSALADPLEPAYGATSVKHWAPPAPSPTMAKEREPKPVPKPEPKPEPKKVDITKVKLDDEIVLGSGIKWKHMIKRASDYGYGLENIPTADRTNIVELVTQLKVIKDNSGGRLFVTPAGGWRTKKQNLDRTGPAKNSRHLRGKAADIVLDSSFLWSNYKDLFQKMSEKKDLSEDLLEWFNKNEVDDPVITDKRIIISLIQSFHIIKLMAEGKIKSGRVLIYVADTFHTHYDIAKGPYIDSKTAGQVELVWLYYMMAASPHGSATLKSWPKNSAILKW